MTPLSERDGFTITFIPIPAGKDHLGRDPVYRVKMLLKHALRSCGLKCVEVKPYRPDDDKHG